MKEGPKGDGDGQVQRHVELDQNVGQCGIGVACQSTGADHNHDILETELELCSPNGLP